MTRSPRGPNRLAPVALAVALGFSGCLPSGVEPTISNNGRPVLFIGNSLTYFNGLPWIVQGLADTAGDSLAVGVFAVPNVALMDHWKQGGARAEIERQKWDFVVLQQGPSSTDLNRDTLRIAVKLFQPSITKAGAKAVLFSAWPTIDRRQDFPRAIESYRLAAADVGGLFAPVASAWLAAWSRDSTLQLYATDGLHPSVLGSYLTAVVLYSKILGKNPVGLPASFRLRSGDRLNVSPSLAKLVQEAAWEAVSSSTRPP